MNLRALMDRKNLNKNLVVVLLLTLLPTGFGPLPNANAVKASSLTSNSLEASCASTVSDSSTAKLDVIIDGNYCVLSFLSFCMQSLSLLSALLSERSTSVNRPVISSEQWRLLSSVSSVTNNSATIIALIDSLRDCMCVC